MAISSIDLEQGLQGVKNNFFIDTLIFHDKVLTFWEGSMVLNCDNKLTWICV